jgi:hypothetical protein
MKIAALSLLFTYLVVVILVVSVDSFEVSDKKVDANDKKPLNNEFLRKKILPDFEIQESTSQIEAKSFLNIVSQLNLDGYKKVYGKYLNNLFALHAQILVQI